MTPQEACVQAFENGRKVGDAEGYARGKAEAMNETVYRRIMNRMFLAAEDVCGNEMVELETVGNIIREECGMDGDGNA